MLSVVNSFHILTSASVSLTLTGTFLYTNSLKSLLHVYNGPFSIMESWFFVSGNIRGVRIGKVNERFSSVGDDTIY